MCLTSGSGTPEAAPAAANGSESQQDCLPACCRYSFDHGPIHFLQLDTELDYAPASKQFDFMLHDLQTVNRTVTVSPQAAKHGFSASGQPRAHSLLACARQPVLQTANLREAAAPELTAVEALASAASQLRVKQLAFAQPAMITDCATITGPGLAEAAH